MSSYKRIYDKLNKWKIKGGKAAIYVTDTLIKITASTKLEEDKLYGIKGFEAKIELCKSRHAPAGRSIDMVYDQREGFDNEFSMLDYIKANNMLGGNGMAYYIIGHDKTKFKMSTFKEKLATDKDFKDYFYKTCRDLLYKSIKESKLEAHTGDKEDDTAVETQPVPEEEVVDEQSKSDSE